MKLNSKWKTFLGTIAGAVVLVWLASLQPRPCSTCLLMPDFESMKSPSRSSAGSPAEGQSSAAVGKAPLPAVSSDGEGVTVLPSTPLSSTASLPVTAPGTLPLPLPPPQSVAPVGPPSMLSRLSELMMPLLPSPSPPRLVLPYAPPPGEDKWRALNPAERLANARARLLPQLHTALSSKGAKLGSAAFIRVLKEESLLELWLRTEVASGTPSHADWVLFRSYPIAAFSGTLGPKQREGDGQAPEGVYTVGRAQLNPASSYHLSFNMGYPNAYDLQHLRTGSHIMVHGADVSVGCYAMTDPVIEEIYLIVEAALLSGQPQVAIHAFPFRMTPARMASVAESHPWRSFWMELSSVYEAFERLNKPPTITVQGGHYQVARQ